MVSSVSATDLTIHPQLMYKTRPFQLDGITVDSADDSQDCNVVILGGNVLLILVDSLHGEIFLLFISEPTAGISL